MNDRNDKGLSDALGAIVLISVVALGVTLAGLAILSGPLPARMPALNVEVTNTSDTVFIRHTGGDPLVRGEYRILADGNDRTAAFLSGSAVPAQWSVGDTLAYHIPAGQEIPSSIQVVAITGNREQTILQVQVRPPTLVPTYITSTLSPTVTPTSTITTATPTATTTTITATTTPVPSPVASFTGTPTSGTSPLAVTFTDTSTNIPTSWSWTFGDSGTSAVQNPSHTYTTPGTYTVTLTAANAGGSNTVIKTSYIMVNPPGPVADFNANPRSGSAPLVVQFADTSTNSPTSWSWTFGDSGTSAVQNPSHAYTTPGTYTVTLTAANAGGSNTVTKTSYITVNAPLVASFIWTEDGNSGNVDFTDTSTGGPTSWLWNFGDGSGTSSQKIPPKHKYVKGHSYTVTLTITRSSDGATSTAQQLISV